MIPHVGTYIVHYDYKEAERERERERERLKYNINAQEKISKENHKWKESDQVRD